MISLVWRILCIAILFSIVELVSPACDMEKAEVCVQEMEDVMTQVLEGTAGVGRTGRLHQLCLDVIKGNNLTQCFINATSECTESSDVGPNSTIHRWERIMQDLYRLCDGACPDFLQRTVNITQCTALIRFDALYDASYQVFCSSLNESLECVHDVSETCPAFGQLFFDLLPDGMEDTAEAICAGDCDRFDEAMAHLETCKKYVMNMPEDLDKACVSYQQFKTCIRLTETPVTCPMFASLLEVLYPQHIFGLYEQSCRYNTTLGVSGQTGDNDEAKCGEMGMARINHCVRVFALAWPALGKEDSPTKDQCQNFQRGTKCLETSGFNECASLREYFEDKIGRRQRQKEDMVDRCSEILGGPGSGTAKSTPSRLQSLIINSLVFLLTSIIYRSQIMT